MRWPSFIQKIASYLNSDKRWHEIGHVAIYMIIALPFASTVFSNTLVFVIAYSALFVFILFDELIIDGHLCFWNEAKLKRRDFYFDLWSKCGGLLTALFYTVSINWANGGILKTMGVFGVTTILALFVFSYKSKWFKRKI